MATDEELKSSEEAIKQFEAEIKKHQEKILFLQGKTGARIQLEFSTQTGQHSPEPEKIPPYERVMYRYKATSTMPQELAQRVRFQQLDHTARFYRDKTDDEFRSHPDIIEAIKKSDLEIAWVERTQRCTQCQQWAYYLADAKMCDESSCANCMAVKLNKIDKEIQELEQKISIERNKHLVEFATKRLGLSVKSVTEFLKNRGDHGKEYLSRAELLEIPRTTLNLTELAKPKEVWKIKTVAPNYPVAFVEFCTKLDLKEADWILGSIQDKTMYAEARKAWAEVVKLPQSPRLRGILVAFGATEEILKHFEERLVVKRESATASAAEMVKQKTNKENQVFLSNEPDPLFNIGAWGNGHYASCQNYIGGGWGNGYCRTLASLLDPTIRVIWYGTPTTMIARQLVRERIHPDTKKKIWVTDAHYGASTHTQSLKTALAAYAKTLDIDVHSVGGNKMAYTEHDVDFKRIGPSYFDGGNNIQQTKGTLYKLGCTIGPKISS